MTTGHSTMGPRPAPGSAVARRRARALSAVALLAAVVLGGCARTTGGGTDVDVANRAGQEVASPSAEHTASLQPAGEDGGVPMLAV